MRSDYVLAIVLAMSAVPFGVLVMAAPLYWEIPKHHLALCVWLGLSLTASLLVLAALIALYGDAHLNLSSSARTFSLGLLVIFLMGAIASGTVYFWSSKKENEITSTDMDYSVAIKCSFARLPTAARADKPLQYLQIIGPPPNAKADTRIYIANTFQTPGNYTTTWPIGMNPFGLRCVVSNYGSRAIASIFFGIKIQWREDIRNERGSQSGEVLAEATYDFGSLDLSPPPGQTDYFYIFSTAQAYAFVSLPEEARVIFVGSDDTHTIKLVKRNSPVLDQYALSPFVPPIDHPDGSLPDPVPQSPPAGK